MSDSSISDQCSDETQQIVVNIPCQLAARVEKYALATGNNITGVVIEALDALLMRAVKKS